LRPVSALQMINMKGKRTVKPKDPELTLMLYMSDRFSTPFWGVHVSGNSEVLSTLCGMEFDDDGICTQKGMFREGELLRPAHGDVVTCPECIGVIEELKSVPVDLTRSAATRRLQERRMREKLKRDSDASA
jgi:hypothetical protein